MEVRRMTGGGSKAGGVFVLSAAAGAGHVRSAEALVAAFAAKRIAAKHVGGLKNSSSFFKKVFSALYFELVNRQPAILGLVYDAMDHPWMYRKRRLALDLLNTRPLANLLKEERPRLAVCTHFLPAEILLHLRRKKILDIPVGVVITDFDLHAMWLYRGVDWYFVACEETKVHMAARGVHDRDGAVDGGLGSPRGEGGGAHQFGGAGLRPGDGHHQPDPGTGGAQQRPTSRGGGRRAVQQPPRSG